MRRAASVKSARRASELRQTAVSLPACPIVTTAKPLPTSASISAGGAELPCASPGSTSTRAGAAEAGACHWAVMTRSRLASVHCQRPEFTDSGVSSRQGGGGNGNGAATATIAGGCGVEHDASSTATPAATLYTHCIPPRHTSFIEPSP
jgi:hypothetical protein